MPSTHFAYPQVDSRTFGSFRALIFSISAVHSALRAWFDSRQLHNRNTGQTRKLWPVFFFHRHLIDIDSPRSPYGVASGWHAHPTCQALTLQPPRVAGDVGVAG